MSIESCDQLLPKRNADIDINKRQIQKLTKGSITEMMRESSWADARNKINVLDWGIDEIEEEAAWKPEDGRTTRRRVLVQVQQHQLLRLCSLSELFRFSLFNFSFSW